MSERHKPCGFCLAEKRKKLPSDEMKDQLASVSLAGDDEDADSYSCASCLNRGKRKLTPPPVSRSPSTPTADSNLLHEQQSDEADVDDQPIDMTKKKLSTEDESQSGLKDSVEPASVQLMTRPSVITCASSLLKAQCASGDCQPPNPTSVDNQQPADNQPVKSSVSGVCDPIIDEHFRRSLGKEYCEVFSSAANDIPTTVDDHFAKALGDTWVQLQNTDTSSQNNPQRFMASL